MDRLALETLQSVVHNVDRQDLFSVRFVNKALASAAAPRLFEVIPLWLGVDSLDRLTCLSEHQTLSTYVNEIYCSPIHFLKSTEADNYAHRYREWLDYHDMSISKSLLVSAKHLSAYKSYMEGQRLLAKTDADVKILTATFKKLPKLESIVIDWNNSTIGLKSITHDFGMLHPGILLSYDCKRLLSVVFRALVASHRTLRSLCLGYYQGYGNYNPDNVLHNQASPRVDATPTNGLTKMFGTPSVLGWHRVLSTLEELRIGSLSCTVAEEDRERISTVMNSLLQSCPDLRLFQMDDVDIGEQYEWEDFMPHGLPNLREIHLEQVECKEVEIVGFMNRHAQTLEDVMCHCVCIIQGDWLAALGQMRAGGLH